MRFIPTLVLSALLLLGGSSVAGADDATEQLHDEIRKLMGEIVELTARIDQLQKDVAAIEKAQKDAEMGTERGPGRDPDVNWQLRNGLLWPKKRKFDHDVTFTGREKDGHAYSWTSRMPLFKDGAQGLRFEEAWLEVGVPTREFGAPLVHYRVHLDWKADEVAGVLKRHEMQDLVTQFSFHCVAERLHKSAAHAKHHMDGASGTTEVMGSTSIGAFLKAIRSDDFSIQVGGRKHVRLKLGTKALEALRDLASRVR